MAEHWMQKAFGNSHGQFKAKAKRAGMSTEAYANKEANNPKASTHLKRQANLAKLGAKYGGGHHAHQPHPKTNPGEYDNEAHENPRGKAPRPSPAHLQENPGEADMHTQPHAPMMGEPHSFRPPATSNAHGYGHSSSQRHGSHRLSGHPGAHRIGSK
jgi:hypothetical protein